MHRIKYAPPSMPGKSDGGECNEEGFASEAGANHLFYFGLWRCLGRIGSIGGA